MEDKKYEKHLKRIKILEENFKPTINLKYIYNNVFNNYINTPDTLILESINQIKDINKIINEKVKNENIKIDFCFKEYKDNTLKIISINRYSGKTCIVDLNKYSILIFLEQNRLMSHELINNRFSYFYKIIMKDETQYYVGDVYKTFIKGFIHNYSCVFKIHENDIHKVNDIFKDKNLKLTCKTVKINNENKKILLDENENENYYKPDDKIKFILPNENNMFTLEYIGSKDYIKVKEID